MGRSADYTIQGFLYQFNKTILEILAAENDQLITIEGIIEDIEINDSFVRNNIVIELVIELGLLISFYNYKHFLLLLIYGGITSII